MNFDIPIVLFLFKRVDTLPEIIGRIGKVNPKKIYLIADGPRNENEKILTNKCRKEALDLIDWECEVVKKFSDKNLGVIGNIGEGARWVFEREQTAIFLEDDNLPEITFFKFCEEMLSKYKDNLNVLWVCGTNYLGKSENNYSYYFTQHLLPCGWASWSNKFLNNYDIYLKNIDNQEQLLKFKNSYENKSLYNQQLYSVLRTKYLIDSKTSEASWDYQMLFSLRANQMYGISPIYNQIKNIGVDEYSIHGGNSWKKTMTKRFCGVETYPLQFPLSHPSQIEKNSNYEKKIGKIILIPFQDRLKRKLASFIKPLFGLKPYDSMYEYLKKK